MKRIKDFFDSENIELFSVLPSDTAEIRTPSKADEVGGYKSVIVFLIPYYTPLSPHRNMARFAAARDYHMYAAGLFERFRAIFPHCRCYCDNSPIDEKALAARAGLGFIGDNSLIINEKYGSYIFIGEIFLPDEFESYSPVCEPKHCTSCGKCRLACPVGLDFERCVSSVNQTKKITPEMQEAIKASHYKWGCDICQDVCPHNQNIPQTPIEFFKQQLRDTLTPDDIDEMVRDGSFSQRAYAWRGENTIKRNLEK